MIEAEILPSGGRLSSPRRAQGVRSYAETLLLVAGATGAGLLMAPSLGTSAIDLLYLPPVMAAASLFGLRQGLFAGAASALAYNFFFTEPLHSLRIQDPRNVVTVAILFLVAIVMSELASRMRSQADVATRSAAQNATLAGIAERLIACASEADIGEVVCGDIGRLFDINAIYLSNEGGSLSLIASHPEFRRLNDIDAAAARAAMEDGHVAGRGTGRFNAADWRFHPLDAGGKAVALLGLARDDGREPVNREWLPLLGSLLNQAALAVERARLAREMAGVDQLRERDRLSGALLSSVSHDLRTPLTAILASAAELRGRCVDADQPLIDALEGEALRLDRLVGNLLDMARVEAGAIRLSNEAIDLTDAVASATRDVRRGLEGHALRIDVPADLPLVSADPQLLHHCLINLLDNAGRHSDPGGPIRVWARSGADGVSLAVRDEGPGIPAGLDEEIFQPFSQSGDGSRGGSGLGLAIAKGFADAMGIGLFAGNRSDPRGAEFTLLFPDRLVLAAPGEVPE